VQTFSLLPFAHAVCGPSVLVVNDEEFLTFIDDDQVSRGLMRRVGQIGGEVQKPRAVLIDGIRPGERPLYRRAIKTSDLIRREGSDTIEDDSRNRNEGTGTQLLTFELEATHLQRFQYQLITLFKP